MGKHPGVCVGCGQAGPWGRCFQAFLLKKEAFLVVFWGHRALREVQGVGMPPAPLIHCPDEISEQFS